MDRRTKKQKLESMANQSVSPNEAEIAKAKLAALPPDSKPPVVIPAPSGVVGGSFWTGNFNFTSTLGYMDEDTVYVYDFVNEKWRKVT